MTRDEVFDKLKLNLCDLFEFPEGKIQWETHLVDDLDLDSIDLFDLLSKIEDSVCIELLPEEFKDCHTVEHVVDKLLLLLENENTKPEPLPGAAS